MLQWWTVHISMTDIRYGWGQAKFFWRWRKSLYFDATYVSIIFRNLASLLDFEKCSMNYFSLQDYTLKLLSFIQIFSWVIDGNLWFPWYHAKQTISNSKSLTALQNEQRFSIVDKKLWKNIQNLDMNNHIEKFRIQSCSMIILGEFYRNFRSSFK